MNISLNRSRGGGTVLYLQVCAQEGLPLGVLVVVPHQQVEQRRRLGPQGAQLGHAALEHLAAQRLAQCHTALEQHRRELEGYRVSRLKVRHKTQKQDIIIDYTMVFILVREKRKPPFFPSVF